MTEQKTYKLKMWCSNCYNKQEVDVPFGFIVYTEPKATKSFYYGNVDKVTNIEKLSKLNFLYSDKKTFQCNNCGCFTLVKEEKNLCRFI